MLVFLMRCDFSFPLFAIFHFFSVFQRAQRNSEDRSDHSDGTAGVMGCRPIRMAQWTVFLLVQDGQLSVAKVVFL